MEMQQTLRTFVIEKWNPIKYNEIHIGQIRQREEDTT